MKFSITKAGLACGLSFAIVAGALASHIAGSNIAVPIGGAVTIYHYKMGTKTVNCDGSVVIVGNIGIGPVYSITYGAACPPQNPPN